MHHRPIRVLYRYFPLQRKHLLHNFATHSALTLPTHSVPIPRLPTHSVLTPPLPPQKLRSSLPQCNPANCVFDMFSFSEPFPLSIVLCVLVVLQIVSTLLLPVAFVLGSSRLIKYIIGELNYSTMILAPPQLSHQ